MKTILCYGDSNTWGQDSKRSRYAHEVQWPNILQAKLGRDFRVVQEGLSGRVAGNYETTEPHRNGQDPFVAIFLSASPVDVVVIALGTNDLKAKYNQHPQGVVDNLMWYETRIKRLVEDNQNITPRVIYLLPPNFQTGRYFPGDENLRREIIDTFMSLDKASQAIVIDDLELCDDGVHYSIADHARVADKIHEKLKELKI